MSKKYLSVAFAYVGVVIGAGLASGQDLLQYFLSFGAKGLIGIAALGVLNVVFGVVALQLGSYYRSGHHDEVFERRCAASSTSCSSSRALRWAS